MRYEMLKKSMIILMFIGLLPISVNASDVWSKDDSYRQVISSALLIIDWAQTHHIGKTDSGYIETNPILGSKPSREKTNQYFAFMSVANLVIPRMLNAQKRKWVHNIVIGVELGYTTSNYKLGIKASF